MLYTYYMTELSVKLIRSKRKTVALAVTGERELTLKLPPWVSEQQIQDLLAQKQEWISKKLQEYKNSQPVPKKFIAGELFNYLGEQFPLTVSNDYFRGLRFNSGFVVSKFSQLKTKTLFVAWYKEAARTLLASRVLFYSERMQTNVKLVRITSASTRWGSASTRGRLNFSWKLVMAPLWVIDYVVVHELAHVTFNNHGKAFWSLVNEYYPNWKEAREWLKSNKNIANM